MTNGVRGGVVADCLEAGRHVIADKPLCTSLDDLDRIEAAWRASGRQLSLLLDKRFYGPTLAARDLIAAGELGDLALAWASGPHRLRRETRPDWMFRHASYGGILNDLCIHDIDLLLWLSGARSGMVQGLAGNIRYPELPEFQDYGQVLLRTDAGLLATSEAHWFSPEASPYHGDYRMVLLLLAILNGYPAQATELLRAVRVEPASTSWWAFVRRFEARGRLPEGPDADDAASVDRGEMVRWAALLDALERARTAVYAQGDLIWPADLSCEAFARWAPEVSRYSFQSGRVLLAG